MSAIGLVALVVLVPGLAGYLALDLALGRGRLGDELFGKLPVGLALGLGLTGATTFVAMMTFGRVGVLVELALLLALLAAFVRARRRALPAPVVDVTPRWARVGLIGALVVVSSCALALFVSEALHEPHGAWDAWDFWNMRARFFVRAGDDWERAYAEVMVWSHPSYPPLLSASVARGFSLGATESLLVPLTIAAAFTIGAVAIVGWTVWRLRGGAQAALALLALLAAPYFAIHGADQYADTPLSFFLAGSVALLALYDAEERGGYLVLAGLSASLAALTKNEGMLFFVCVVLARSAVALRLGGRARWRAEAWRFALGAAPVAALVLVFKLGFAATEVIGEFYAGPVGDWDHGPLEHVLQQGSDPVRWRGLLESGWLHLTTFERAPLVPIAAALPIYGAIAGLSSARPRAAVATAALAVSAHLFVTCALFVFWSTYEIRDHMTALERVLLQLLPCVVLAFFLAVRAPFEADARSHAAPEGT